MKCLTMSLFKRSIAPHPRDGPWAWLVCFASTVIFGLSFGYMLSFSVFLPVLIKHFDSNRGSTAWIGSLAIGFSFFCGPLAVKVIEFVGERTVCVCSALVASSLMVVSSFVDNIIILYFSHGVLLGVCGSFILNSLLLIVRKYFKDKLAIAIGITSSGSSLGILFMGPLLHVLIESLGWRGAFRVMSGAMVVIAILSLTYDPHIQEDEQSATITVRRYQGHQRQTRCRGFVDCSIWRSSRYIVGITAIFLTYFGLFVPSIHLIKFAEDRGIHKAKASLLFIYIGVCSTIIRLVIGKIIEKRWITPLEGVQFSSFTIGFSMIVFTQATAYYHFVLFAIFYGIGSGAFTTTLALFFLTCFDDLNKASVSLSTGLTVSSIALFTGAPTAGIIADHFQSYIPAFYIFGGLLVFAGCVPFVLWCGPKANERPEIAGSSARCFPFGNLCGPKARPGPIMDFDRLKLVGYRLATVDSGNRYSTYIDEGVKV